MRSYFQVGMIDFLHTILSLIQRCPIYPFWNKADDSKMIDSLKVLGNVVEKDKRIKPFRAEYTPDLAIRYRESR